MRSDRRGADASRAPAGITHSGSPAGGGRRSEGDTPRESAVDSGSSAPRARRRWEAIVAAAGLAVMAAITLANVATRYFTNQSFAWTEEMSVALMVIVTLLGASAATIERGHVRIELVADAGTPARRFVLAVIAAIATVAVFAGMTVLGAQMAWDDFRFEVTSPGIGVPQWWYTVWLPVLSAVITVRALQVLAGTWHRRGR